MNENTTSRATLDQADDEILAYEVSDEALEAAAGTQRGPNSTQRVNPTMCYCIL